MLSALNRISVSSSKNDKNTTKQKKPHNSYVHSIGQLVDRTLKSEDIQQFITITPKDQQLESIKSLASECYLLHNEKKNKLKQLHALESLLHSNEASLINTGRVFEDQELLFPKGIHSKPPAPLHFELLHSISEEWNCPDIQVSMILQLWYCINTFHSVYSIFPFTLNQLYQSLLYDSSKEENQSEDSTSTENTNQYLVSLIGQKLVNSILVDYEYDLEDNEENENHSDEESPRPDVEEGNETPKKPHYYDVLSLSDALCNSSSWFEIGLYLFHRHLTGNDIDMKMGYKEIVEEAVKVAHTTDWYKMNYVQKLGYLYGLLQISLISNQVCCLEGVGDERRCRMKCMTTCRPKRNCLQNMAPTLNMYAVRSSSDDSRESRRLQSIFIERKVIE